MQRHVVVIGGGIAGAAAAHSLARAGYEVTIVERNDRLGGRIRSEIVDGAAVEMGAAFITNAYKNVRAFLVAGGLHSSLYRQHGGSGILRGGKIKMATLGTLAGNDALSWGAKLQALPLLLKILGGWPQLDMHAPWRAYKYDSQSVADMFEGRFGKEFLEYVVQPILNGYFYWTPEATSEAMLLMIGKIMGQGGMYKLRDGLQQIPEKAAQGCQVLLGHTVKLVERSPDGAYKVVGERGREMFELQADGVVCATTASVVPQIIPALSERQRVFFASIGYSSTAVVAQTYRWSQQAPGSRSVAFPRKEGSNLAAITVSPELGANGQISAIKAYASGVVGKALFQESDDEIIAKLAREMEPLRRDGLLPQAIPASTHVQRWHEALPVFEHGHLESLRAFANGQIESSDQALVFAGDYLGGPFMEGAFTSGLQAAGRLGLRIAAQR